MVQLKKSLLAFGLILSVFASQDIWVSFSPVVTNVAGNLGVSETLVGYLAITFPAFFLALTVPSGILLDRDFRLWLLLGIAFTFAGGAGRLLDLSSYYWLLGCQLLGAFGQPFLLNAFVPFASRLYPGRSALAVSALSLSMYMGTIFALSAGLMLYNTGGMLFVAIPPAAIALAGLIIFLATGSVIPDAPSERKRIDLRKVIGRKDLWILGVILGLGVATFDNLSTWLEPALQSVNLQNIAGTAVAVAIVTGLVGVVFIPSIVSGRNIRTLYLRIIIPVITVLFGTLALVIDQILLFSFLTVAGLLMVPAYPIIMEWIGKFHEKDLHGSATGFVGLVSRAISVSLTFAAAAFIYSAGSYFAFLAFSVLVATVFVILLPSDRKMQAAA